MPNQVTATVKVDLDEFKTAFGGEKIWEFSLKMSKTLKDYLNNSENFTGKIIFNVNCSNGGIGSVEAFVQKKI